MATPRTVNTWPLNGTQREFDLTFDYLSRNFVKVTILGGPLPIPLTQGTDFVFVTNTRIRTTVAYGAPNTLIEIRRVTSTTERLVEFQDASILHALDLNIDSLQVLHVAEEAREAATETIGVNNDGHLDARGRRIVNVQDPVNPQDVATKNYVDTAAGGVGQARDQAIAARDAAKVHRDAAASSATQSAQSASAAGTYAGTAQTHRDAAKVSQDASKVSQDASKASENAASASAGASQTSADASKASELKAKDWAEKLPGPVESGAYSAKYWAQQAVALALPDGYISQPKLDAALSAKVNNGQAAFDRNFKDNPQPIQGGNMNDARPSGQYLFNGATGSPNGIVSWFFLEEIRADSSSAAQTATLIHGVGKYANGCKWVRTMTSGAWGAWLEVTAMPQTTILYPGGSPASPGSISIGQRVLLGNPYPGWDVLAIPEIYLEGVWGDPNWASNSGTGTLSYGLRVTQMGDGGNKDLVLRSGASAVHGSGTSTGSPFEITSVIGPLPFRVRVTRLSR